MNVGHLATKKRAYEVGEMRVGTSSPGTDWVRADGSVIEARDSQRLVTKLLDEGQLAWVTSTTDFASSVSLTAVAYGAGVWVVGGSAAFAQTSSDGFTWTTVTTNITQSTALRFAANVFVIGGPSGGIRTSPDGTTWTTRTGATTTAIQYVAYGGGKFLACAATAQMATSTDGTTWTTVTTTTFGTSTINAAAYGNNLWVAVGAGGALRTSTDAVTWTTRTSNTTSNILSVDYGAGGWLAGTATELLTSTDGVTWSVVASSPANINAILWVTNAVPYAGGTGGLWVIGGGSSALQVSTDQTTWVTQRVTGTIQEIAFGANNLIATGSSALVRVAQPSRASLPSAAYENRVWGWVAT